ncbi:MAG: FAD-binding oxidoreductase [Chloroflexi bacterium]|nr:MAG: FAD-binding oxidoreductase [Chloroflexota bacterium]
METADVGIIGAGIHGVSAGYHLAAMGVKTIIFDRWAPAGGPTGRSSAICRAFYTNRFIAQVAHESLEMFGAFDEISGGRDAGFRRTGDLYVLGPEEVAHVQTTAAMLTEIGTAVELLSPSDLGRRHPEMNLDGIAIAALEIDAGYADPVATTQGLFHRAVELGLGPRLYTSRLLIAAGPWTKPLVEQVHVELPLTVERHFVATLGWNQVPALPYVLGDIPGGYYMKPEGSELFLVGPMTSEPQADPDAFSVSVTADEVSRMASAITARIPSLALADARGGWASLYDVSPDWQPVIGEVAPGIFVDAGTSGHGFKLAPALGRHVAALVLGKEVEGIRQFEPGRFETDRLLAAGFGSARIIG